YGQVQTRWSADVPYRFRTTDRSNEIGTLQKCSFSSKPVTESDVSGHYLLQSAKSCRIDSSQAQDGFGRCLPAKRSRSRTLDHIIEDLICPPVLLLLVTKLSLQFAEFCDLIRRQ